MTHIEHKEPYEILKEWKAVDNQNWSIHSTKRRVRRVNWTLKRKESGQSRFSYSFDRTQNEQFQSTNGYPAIHICFKLIKF